MAMKVSDILALEVRKAGRAGAAEAHLHAHRNAYQRSDYGRAQIAFLTKVRDEARDTPRRPRERVLHPGEVALRGAEGRRGYPADQRPGQVTASPEGSSREASAQSELSGAELMWLERLPQDPASISFDDAVRLARIVRSIDYAAAPASTMLVESIWEPIKLLFDERVTRDELDNLPSPATVSPEAWSAIREVLHATHPDWHSDVVDAEAGRLVDEFKDQQFSEHERRKRQLNARLAEIRERTADRTVTTRTGTGPVRPFEARS